MALRNLRGLFSLRVVYKPQPEEQPFLQRVESQHEDDVVVRVTVLDHRESERFFGVPLAHRGIQPVWLHIRNGGDHPYRLRLASLDPNYYAPLEAASVNHFHIGRRSSNKRGAAGGRWPCRAGIPALASGRYRRATRLRSWASLRISVKRKRAR